MFREHFIFLSVWGGVQSMGCCAEGYGMPSRSAEASEGCVEMERGGGHCWLGSVKVQLWEDQYSSGGEGSQLWHKAEGECRSHRCLQSNEQSVSISTLKNSVFCQASFSPPTLPPGHVLSCGPQQYC